MTLFAHIVILASYVLAALAVAMGLPGAIPDVSQPMAYLIAGMVFVGCALLHEVLYRRSERIDLAEDVFDLREALAQTAMEVRTLSDDAGRVRSMLHDAERKSDQRGELLSEMRVLQTLLKQIAEKSGRRRGVKSQNQGHRLVDHGAAHGAAPHRESAADTHGRKPLPPTLDDVSEPEVSDILHHALQENRVDLYLQPVVSLPQRKVRFYEAFSRIRDANGAIIAPEQYLSIAEESGLITTIDNLLLFRCVQLIRRVRQKNMDVGFFVNVSTRTLNDGFFFAQFLEFMEQNRELADNLVFEFGQEALADQNGDVEANLVQLAELGFRFSMDQVTTLDLDLADMARRRILFVKIEADRLVASVEGGQLPVSIYKLRRDLARTGIDLIAEKVETEHSVSELVEYSVDFGQGYLFGEPRPAR